MEDFEYKDIKAALKHLVATYPECVSDEYKERLLESTYKVITDRIESVRLT